MSKILKIAVCSAVLTVSVASFAKDLAQEKGIICAGFYDNAAAFEKFHGDKDMEMKKFKYMLDNVAKYQNKMGVSEEALNSATTRAKDIDLAPFKVFYKEAEAKYSNASQSEIGELFLKYFKAREKKLGC